MRKNSAGRAASFATLVALLAAGIAAQPGGALSAAWKHWQFSAPITGPSGEAALWAVTIPSRVSARSRAGWADLRVLDSAGTETPFVLYARQQKRKTELREGRLFDVSFKAGESTQGIVDLGATPQEHNSLVVQTSEENFFTHVEVASSNDARDWRQIRERVPIYRFATERLAGNQTVNYPASRARYLRVRVLQSEKPFALTGVRVEQDTVVAAELAALEAFLRRDASAAAQQAWWTTDLGHANDPVSQVQFTVEQPEFHRAVRISTTASPDQPHRWAAAGEGDIYRYRRGGQLYEKLAIQLPETQARYWRVEIFNRNDPELAGLKVTLHGTPRRVVFAAKPGAQYRLAFGNTAAHPASYEMARLTEPATLESAAAATLGPEQANPAYEDPSPAPWSERNPYILWGALLVAVVVLGLLAVRSLKSS